MTNLPQKSLQDKHRLEYLIRSQGPISRVSLYKLTSIRRSTISLLTRRLMQEGRIIEAGLSNNALGRKQILLSHNPKFGYIAGVEFDDEMLTAGVMDMEPKLLHTFSEKTELNRGQTGLLEQLERAVRRVVSEAGIPFSKLLGVGIADPGLVDTRAGITASCSTIAFWNQVPVKERLERALNLYTLADSKTRTKTLAEQMLGSGERNPNMIYFDYGSGIGAGILVDGRLLFGQNCGVGEVGHTHVQKDGPACRCGSYGCLEAVAGAVAVEARARKALANGVSSTALTSPGDGTLNAWRVFQAASEGDKLCWNIMAEVAEDLGIAIANLVNLFNPSLVVLDQRLSLAGEDLLTLIRQVIKRQALEISASAVSLRYARLGAETGLLGIGLRIIEEYFAHNTVLSVSDSALRKGQRRAGKARAREDAE